MKHTGGCSKLGLQMRQQQDSLGVLSAHMCGVNMTNSAALHSVIVTWYTIDLSPDIKKSLYTT
jgi:hypothetical protein